MAKALTILTTLALLVACVAATTVTAEESDNDGMSCLQDLLLTVGAAVLGIGILNISGGQRQAQRVKQLQKQKSAMLDIPKEIPVVEKKKKLVKKAPALESVAEESTTASEGGDSDHGTDDSDMSPRRDEETKLSWRAAMTGPKEPLPAKRLFVPKKELKQKPRPNAGAGANNNVPSTLSKGGSALLLLLREEQCEKMKANAAIRPPPGL